MKFISLLDVTDWIGESGLVAGYKRAMDVMRMSRAPEAVPDWSEAGEYDFQEGPAKYLGTTPLLSAAIGQLILEDADATDDDLRSLPFFSLCKGLFLPLAGLDHSRIQRQFGIDWHERPLTRQARTNLVVEFLGREVGLSLFDKVCAVMGDPFGGHKAWVGRESLLESLANVDMVAETKLVDRLPHVGELANLAVETTDRLKSDPPLTAAEVFLGLRHMKRLKLAARRAVVREIFSRAGRLERFFLCGLILRHTHFRNQFDRLTLMRALADRCGVPAETFITAAAIVDVFQVVRILERHGPAGLENIRLQPLHPVAPMLSGDTLPPPKELATQPELAADLKFPLWVEKKFDGVRLLLHKATDAAGAVHLAAFTRDQTDWTETVPGIKLLGTRLPCRDCILDGVVHGFATDETGTRPADIYEVLAQIRGEPVVPVELIFAAFDVIFVNGHDLTTRPFIERRERLQSLLGPIIGRTDNLLLRLDVAQGQMAANLADLNALHDLFTRQGYPGTMVKRPDAPYALGHRAPAWIKRKSQDLLDLVVVGAFFPPQTAAPRRFSAVLVAALDAVEERLLPVGIAENLPRQSADYLLRTVFLNGLATGKPLLIESPDGLQHGVEIMPSVVVSVAFETIVPPAKDTRLVAEQPVESPYILRGASIARVRGTEKGVAEISTIGDLATYFRRKHYG